MQHWPVSTCTGYLDYLFENVPLHVDKQHGGHGVGSMAELIPNKLRRDDSHVSEGKLPAEQTVVNASVLLRPDNFDRPFLLFLSTVDHLQGSLVFVLHEASIGVPTPPGGRSPPPGPSVVDGSCRDERTRDTPQSLPRSLVSFAKPTTGVQVVRPAAPHGLDSLTPDAHRAGPPHPRRHGFASSHRQRGSRQGKIPPKPTLLAPGRH